MTQRLAEEEELRFLQQEAMKVLWSQLNDTRAEVHELQNSRRDRAALTLQRQWRGYRARKVRQQFVVVLQKAFQDCLYALICVSLPC